jgi:excisionase family DNA binding protein
VISEQADYITAGEAARRLGVSTKTITRWANDKRLASTRTLGGHRRFAPAEIERVLAAQRRGGDKL